MNILAIGAHPDDIEFGCGGTLSKYSEKGHKVYMLVLSKGDKGGNSELRQKEQENSARIIRAEMLYFGDYKDTEIVQSQKLITEIESFLKEIKPGFIFVHYHDDTHQDHRNLASSTISATRYIHNVLFYEGPTTQNFTANVFVDISSDLDKKLECLEAHVSQVSKTNIEGLSIIEAAKSTAHFRGIQGRVNYAEAFNSLRLFINI
ncbi:MAG: PIG-L deacetylase family protein [Candidatus Scalindua sp.]|jgi:LmbE family N-acetylglucosaminyl deacetylase|nr:PIG-L deacetylase family protein [Candidatus Scalindua sp.]